jgi:hypothetical protein
MEQPPRGNEGIAVSLGHYPSSWTRVRTRTAFSTTTRHSGRRRIPMDSPRRCSNNSPRRVKTARASECGTRSIWRSALATWRAGPPTGVQPSRELAFSRGRTAFGARRIGGPSGRIGGWTDDAAGAERSSSRRRRTATIARSQGDHDHTDSWKDSSNFLTTVSLCGSTVSP